MRRSPSYSRIAALAAFALCVGPCAAQTYPDKPIRMVVPFAPGGISDILARMTAEKISESLRQSVVVDNRGGASGNIGTALVAAAPADGYTLLFVAPAFATNVSLYSKPGYDPLKDFTPLAQVAAATNLLVTTPAVNVSTLKQLIDAASAKPGALNYGSGGAGTSGQLAAELFQAAAGVKMTHVPYKGAGPALTALLGNEVQLMFSPVILVLSHVASGRLVPLAVTSAQRSRAFPNVPTIAEAAVQGFDVTSWFGVVAPAGTPKQRIALLHGAIVRALQSPEFAEKLAAQGAEAVVRTPEAFGGYIKVEVDKWAGVIRRAGLKAQ